MKEGHIYSSSGGLARSPWPMFHHNVKHTGRVSKSLWEPASILGVQSQSDSDTFNYLLILGNDKGMGALDETLQRSIDALLTNMS